jgi:hypothetical protein
MDGHSIEIIGMILGLSFAWAFVYQGHSVSKGIRGYRNFQKDDHESLNIRRRIEDLLRDKTHGG